MLLVGLLACFVLDGTASGLYGRAFARRLGIAIGANQGAGPRFLFFLRQGLQHDAATAGAALAATRAHGRNDACRRRRCAAAQLQGAAGRRRRRCAGRRYGRGRGRGRSGNRGRSRGTASALDRLLDLDRHRARTPMREFLAHLGRIALGRRAGACRRREGQGLGRLGLFVLIRHVGCCPWSAPARQPALFSR